MSKGVQITAGATLIALLIGWYAMSNLEGGASFAYFQTLEEFRQSEHARAGEAARVHGYVATGSIERDLAAKQVHFLVVNDPPHKGGNGSDPLEVVYLSLETPDLFADGAEVVIEGRLAANGEAFHADKVMAKCPSKFEAEDASTSTL